MNEEKKLVPRLRFEEFSDNDEWEQFELGETVDFLDGQRKPLEASVRESGPYPYYGASGIIDYVKDYIFDEELVLLSEDGANIIDRNSPVAFLASGKYWVNNHAHVLKAKKSFDNGFICEALERINYEKYNTGTAQPKLNQEVCQKIEVIVPRLNEQKRINVFLKNISEMIQLQQAKVNKVKDIKSAYLSEMFPKEGEKYPKRRFEGFTEPWKEYLLNDIAKIIGGGTPDTNNPAYWNGNINWYSPTEIGKKVYVSESVRKITTLGYQNSSANLLPPDKTILFTSRAGIGSMAILKKAGTTNQGFQSLVLNDNINTYFLYSMGHLIKKYAEHNASGSTFMEISGESLGKMLIRIPNTKEQQKIGAFFKNLDTQIAIEEEKLAKLEKLKQAYLNDMFV